MMIDTIFDSVFSNFIQKPKKQKKKQVKKKSKKKVAKKQPSGSRRREILSQDEVDALLSAVRRGARDIRLRRGSE